MKKTLTLILVGMALGSTVAFAAVKLFSDVPSNTWYSDAAESLAEKGIIAGYPDGTFGPTKNVNRAELAVMLDRPIEYIETGDVSSTSSSGEIAFDSYGTLSKYENEEFNISFEYPSNWEAYESIYQNGTTIKVSNENESLENTQVTCGTKNPEVSFSYSENNTSNLMDSIPYEENGGLGRFSGDLEEVTIGGKKALKGIFGDSCGGEDYYVEQSNGKYWLITKPKLTDAQEKEAEEILNSLSF